MVGIVKLLFYVGMIALIVSVPTWATHFFYHLVKHDSAFLPQVLNSGWYLFLHICAGGFITLVALYFKRPSL